MVFFEDLPNGDLTSPSILARALGFKFARGRCVDLNGVAKRLVKTNKKGTSMCKKMSELQAASEKADWDLRVFRERLKHLSIMVSALEMASKKTIHVRYLDEASYYGQKTPGGLKEEGFKLLGGISGYCAEVWEKCEGGGCDDE